jgi:hypothetical protein
MLPESQRSIYQSFRDAVEQFQTMVSQTAGSPINLNRTDPKQNTVSTELHSALIELQKDFQGEICALNLDDLSDSEAHRARSIWVEIDKQLRLLGMDISFVQAARQPETLQKRLAQMQERLKMLMSYCEALLG